MTGELTILKGKVKNLQVQTTTKAIFDDGFQAKAGAAAVGAAAVGAFANAAVFTSLSSRARNRVQMFTCTVKEVELSGYFESITFDEGDKIEFVVEYNPNNPQEAAVHAARDSKRKILSSIPYQDKGEVAYKQRSLKFIIGVSIFSSFFLFILTFMAVGSYDLESILIDLLWSGGGGFFLFLMVGRQKEIPDAIKATRVFAALGYKNPAQVDTSLNHLPAQEIWREVHGKFESLGLNWIHRYQDSDLEK